MLNRLVHLQKGELEKALDYCMKSCSLKQNSSNSEDSRGMATSYNNIGMVYQAMGDHEKALEYSLTS